MKKAIVFFWLTFSVNNILWATSLQWDAPNDSRVVGYKVYEHSALGDNITDVGNVLLFPLPNIKPGVTYAWYATAYSQDQLESDPSNVVVWTESIPPISVEIASAGTLIAHVFKGGTFDLQTTSDFRNWGALQRFTADVDRVKLSVPSKLDLAFFRLKYIVPTNMAQAAVRRQLKAAEMPPMPPLPMVKMKLTFRQRLKLYLKYKPGHHVDERKGAERLKYSR